jgi:D-glycero-alpha-D-manno-heptose-7-phosphate kinase
MIITQTPLRVSFLGGITDFREYYLKHGGVVLTTTIDKYIYCIVKKRFDDLIIVNYSIKESVKNINDIEHELVREALRLLKIESGIEISFLADIPSQGTGLGSSSTVTVGVLNALHTYLGENVSSEQLAEEAVKVEVDILKKPIGVQDQWGTALGGLRELRFNKDGSIDSQKIKIPDSVKEDFNNSLMLFYTGITRKSSDILASLDIGAYTPVIHQIKALAEEGIVALNNGSLKKVAISMDNYWEIKKQTSNKITDSEIDRMYELAKEGGAIGGKIIGAGGGGFLLVMFPANKRAAIVKKLKDYKELPFRFEYGGSKVIFNIQK